MLEMHAGLLTLLKELDEICRKHGITYYLEGGSLLGAVRHKGFLPWDDDVDLCITRDNFKKLLSVIDQELKPNRELYCYERQPNYLRDTVKYTNLDTTVLFRNHILDGNAAGQHIDLFILDPVPADPEKQAEYKKLATVYSELLSPVYVLCEDIGEYLDEYRYYLQMMREKGRDHVLSLLREKLFTYPDGDDVDTYLLRWGNAHRSFPKAFFGKPVEVEFEGNLFPAPKQYYRFLRAEFGDSWMIIPDQEHQEDHDTFRKQHVPCKEFIADYTEYIDYEKMQEQYLLRKQQNLDLIAHKKKLRADNAQMARVLYEMSLADITNEMTEAVQNMLKEKQYAGLASSFDAYYEAQLSDILLNNGIVLTIEEKVLNAAMLALIMVGRFGQAEKILNVADPDSELLVLIRDIRACVLASEEERFEDGKMLAEKWIGRYPLQVNLATFLIRQGIREKVALTELTEQTRQLMEHYPDRDDLMYLMGDLATLAEEHENARHWYGKCARITRNGQILLALPEEIRNAVLY